MNKKYIVIIILLIAFTGFAYMQFGKRGSKESIESQSAQQQSTENQLPSLTDADKNNIADALIEGRNLFRSGDVNAIRKYLVTSKPDKKFDTLPDSAIKSLSAFLVNNKENFSKEEILASKTWELNGNKAYVSIDRGSATSRLEAIKIGDKWYRY